MNFVFINDEAIRQVIIPSNGVFSDYCCFRSKTLHVLQGLTTLHTKIIIKHNNLYQIFLIGDMYCRDKLSLFTNDLFFLPVQAEAGVGINVYYFL